MKKLDSKLQKHQQGWPKISNTTKKYNKGRESLGRNGVKTCFMAVS